MARRNHLFLSFESIETSTEAATQNANERRKIKKNTVYEEEHRYRTKSVYIVHTEIEFNTGVDTVL